MSCPFCSSTEVERVAQWGGQIITAQWRCNACSSYFEAVREDFDDELGAGPPGGAAAAGRAKGSL
jgi:hypothetical protein